MQIPIVNEHHFQTSEAQIYEPPKKNVQKKKFAIALILLLLVASLFGFIAMGMFGSKYAEVPDLKGKTEKEAENTATISFRNW